MAKEMKKSLYDILGVAKNASQVSCLIENANHCKF